MVSTSKILTVSYGTFSCTLEGFDDSFETMKAIAEYFRDLAADDRYFGAEPPTPDAEMLARIAEREISRRVEAHEEHGKIHLRADESSDATEALMHTPPVVAPVSDENEVELSADEGDQITGEGTELPAEDAAILDDIHEDAHEDTKPSEEVAFEESESALDSEEATDAEEENSEDADLAAFLADAEADEAHQVKAEDNGEEPELAAPETVVLTAPQEAVSEVDAETRYEAQDDLGADYTDAASAAELAHVLDEGDSAEDIGETPQQLADRETQIDDADSVAEKLRRIRSVVSQSELDYEASEYTEDEHAQDVLDSPSEELDALLSASSEQFDEELVQTEAIVAVDAPENWDEDETTVEAEDTLDTIMEDFAEHSKETAPAEIATDTEINSSDGDDPELVVAEDEVTQPHLDEDTLSQLLADAAPVDAETNAEVPEIAADLDSEQEDDLSQDDAPESLFADLEDVIPDEGALAEDKADGSEAVTPLVLGEDARVTEKSGEQLKDDLNTRVLKLKRPQIEEAVAPRAIEEDTDPEDREEFRADDEVLLSPEDEADLQRELAEVEAELQRPDPEPFEEQVIPVTETDIASEATEHSDIDDAELVEEADQAHDEDPVEEKIAVETSAESESEQPETSEETVAANKPSVVAPEDLDVQDAPEGEAQAPEEKPRRGLARLLGLGKRAPEDEERLFEEADTQMGDKDASMRRTAIQHLRAAVAATQAEKSAGVEIEKVVDEAPYRSDLAEVVRPRRPTTTPPTMRSERPSEQRAAPLKLVAEQRVDTDREPVRPRRVSGMVASDIPGSDGGFIAFAEEMGATELSDLLEAAAAYMSDVEGHEEFTRPMLMGKLKEVKSDSYSREDGLRSFGQLLREGKLRKLKGGRFAATDETEFRAEARNAG